MSGWFGLRSGCFLAAILYVGLFIMPATQVHAEISPKLLEGLDGQLVQDANAGDPYAAYNLGYQFISENSSTEEELRAAVTYLEIAYNGFVVLDNDDRQYAGLSARALGATLWRLSESAAALEWSSKALVIYHEMNHVEGAAIMQAVILEDMAITLQEVSRYDDSLPFLSQARAIYLSQTPVDQNAIANTYLNEGVGLEGAKRYSEALAAYKQSMAGFVATLGEEAAQVGYLANNIGWVYRRLEDFGAAEEWLLRAQPIIEAHEGSFSPNANKVRVNLALIALEQGKPQQAIRLGMLAMPYIAVNRQQSLSDQRWLFEMFSQAYAELKDREKAIFFGKMAVNAQQEIRALNKEMAESDTADLREEWRRLYQNLADLLIQDGRISEAQAVLNMEKEQQVFEFLRRDAAADLAATRAILNDAELSIEERLAALAEIPVRAESAIRTLTAKIEAGTATIEEEDQLFDLQDALQIATNKFQEEVEAFLNEVAANQRDALADQFKAVGSYQAVLEQLGTSAAILQVAALDKRVHLFLTLPGVTVHREVAIDRAELARMVLDMLQAMERRDPTIQSQLEALHAVVFAPVQDALTQAETKVVMLNLEGFLRYVPFAALHDGQAFLVESFAFSQYSTAVPTQFARASRDAEKAAGFGVTQAHPGFSALPGVAHELATIFGNDSSQGVLAGNAVLDDAFDTRSLRRTLLKKPEILHIASHFALQPGQEDDSYLLMGDGGRLSLADIRSQRAYKFQGVDLLTLSACQTARGGDGSEIDGFGATAQLNGASAVLASLWPVADDATPQLMHDFYSNMIVAEMTKAEALQKAQIDMLYGSETGGSASTRAAAALEEDGPEVPFAHPYYWSAFLLMGNWL